MQRVPASLRRGDRKHGEKIPSSSFDRSRARHLEALQFARLGDGHQIVPAQVRQLRGAGAAELSNLSRDDLVSVAKARKLEGLEVSGTGAVEARARDFLAVFSIAAAQARRDALHSSTSSELLPEYKSEPPPPPLDTPPSRGSSYRLPECSPAYAEPPPVVRATSAEELRERFRNVGLSDDLSP